MRNITNEQDVTLEVLGKICAVLHANLGDIAQFVELLLAISCPLWHTLVGGDSIEGNKLPPSGTDPFEHRLACRSAQQALSEHY